jgi:hypothetical protein
VGSETLSQRVKYLRDALNDDPRVPAIAGLRGWGYQIIATIGEIADYSAATSTRTISVTSAAWLQLTTGIGARRIQRPRALFDESMPLPFSKTGTRSGFRRIRYHIRLK